MFRLISKKKREDIPEPPDIYVLPYFKAPDETADLPDLPNLSSLRSANKDGDLPDLYLEEVRESPQDVAKRNRTLAKDEKKNMKRRSRIIDDNLKQLRKYYERYPEAGRKTAISESVDDDEPTYKDAGKKPAKKNKIRSRDMVRKYAHLRFQAWSLVLIVIALTTGLAASYNDTRVFTHEEAIPAVALKVRTARNLVPVEYDAEADKATFGEYNIKYISQVAEGLPNGCEAVSLAMVLSRFIPNITPHEIIEKYLPRVAIGIYNGVYISEDPTNYYIGDPAGRGYGIFADGLTVAAKNVLNAYNIDREVINISGCSDKELLQYVADGYPVIVWSTLGLRPVTWGAYSWHLPTGKIYRYPGNQHCCVLVSYNDTGVVLYDPTDGEVTHDAALFLTRWAEIGPYANKTRQAIVIK